MAASKAIPCLAKLKDDTLDDPDLLPPPEEVAAEIVENLEMALERFRRGGRGLEPFVRLGSNVLTGWPRQFFGAAIK